MLWNYHVALPAFINKRFNISDNCSPYDHYNIWNEPMKLACGDQEAKFHAKNYITDNSWADRISTKCALHEQFKALRLISSYIKFQL